MVITHISDGDKLSAHDAVHGTLQLGATAGRLQLRPSVCHAGVIYGQYRQAGHGHDFATQSVMRVAEAWADGALWSATDVLAIPDNEILSVLDQVVGIPADDWGGVFDLGTQYGTRRQAGQSDATAKYGAGAWLALWYGPNPWPEPVPERPTRIVRPLVGYARTLGSSFGDDTGARLVHGCSDFAALAKHHQDRDKSLRQLDVVAAYQQYVRVLWRLNGAYWTKSGCTNDPIRDPWFDDVLRDYLQACVDRGIRVNMTSGDLNNWSVRQAEDSFKRVAQICASVSRDVVWLAAATNELRGTMDGGESDENIAHCERLMRIWEREYPWSLRAISDPHSQDKVGMKRLSGGNANVALIHDVRWQTNDALRRAFNTMYENYPDEPVVQDEPTGPNGSPPHSEFSRLVYQPVEDHDDLLAIYTMHVITGQASTYFNDPALASRQPLESTWGFREIPEIWRALEIPEAIGQGRLLAGHLSDAPLQVVGSNAERADSAAFGNYAIGVISGGRNWRVRAGYDGQALACTAAGVVWEGRVSAGQVLPIAGPTPTIVRILR